MKKPLERVTPENLAQCEKEVRRLERRRERTLAGRAAGWTAGDIIFVPVFMAALFCLPAASELAAASPFRALAPLWRDICRSLPLPGPAQGEGFAVMSMLAAVLLAAAANLLVGSAVRLIWVQRRETYASAQDSGLPQARALARRCSAAVADCPCRRWYVSLIVAVVYAAAVLLPLPGIPAPVQEAASETEETGRLLLSGHTFAALALAVLLFLFFYLIYRALSGLLLRKLDGLCCAGGRRLASALEAWEAQPACHEKHAAQRGEEEQKRLQGDALYRRAIAGKPLDEELIAQAADLGCRPACLYMGRRLLEAWSAGTYTAEEKQELAEAGKEYFRIASLEENFPRSQAEGEFGYLTFVCVTESAGCARWRDILGRLRSIQSSGLLPENLARRCSLLARTVEEMADASAEKERAAAQAASFSGRSCGSGGTYEEKPADGTDSGGGQLARGEWNRPNDDTDAVQDAPEGPG